MALVHAQQNGTALETRQRTAGFECHGRVEALAIGLGALIHAAVAAPPS